MADNIECEVCGGTDFYKESGYFFCNECQTQSQEIREHVFQEEIGNVNVKSTRKIKKPKSNKVDKKITSWECYNVVMYSLTQQLIDLGADKNLKPIVKCLWMRYLEKLEVLNLQYDAQPKLPLVNNRRDVNILYGPVKKKRKRKISTSDESSLSPEASSTRREISKKKRALAQAQYEEFSQKSTQDNTSLQNETLTSLRSSSERSVKAETSLAFSKHSIKELRKRISKRHYVRHKRDKEQTLKCHKLTYNGCSKDYKRGVYFLSPIKLYCVLYLGLLINKDRMHLGDLFRFIREGHLSFNNYTRLFPEDYSDKFLNISNNTKKTLFSNKYFRVTAAKLAKFLDVVHYIEVVDLADLCRRFCREMNLPGEICSAVENLMSKTNPRLKFTKQDTMLPNYEGRAVSMILFTLKLLFGLDGVTEIEFSKYAQLFNDLKLNKHKMFDVIKWIKYVGYRGLVISEYHFPTYYSKNLDEINSDLFLQYVKLKDIQVDENVKLTKEMNNYKELLVKMQELQGDDNTPPEFPASLTPFFDYTKMLLNKITPDQANVLGEDFQENSLDFLLRPNKYLRLVGGNVKVKHGGANNNWVVEDVKTYRTVKQNSRENVKLIPVEIVRTGQEHYVSEILRQKQSEHPKRLYDAKYLQAQYEKCRKHMFQKNELYVKRISERVELNEDVDVEAPRSYIRHFNPYERYWLYLQMNIERLNKEECDDYFNKHTETFKVIFAECARIVEQTIQELLCEFQCCELFLTYATLYRGKSDTPTSRKLLDTNLLYYVTQAEACW